VLRETRRASGLTLRQAAARSAGNFRPTSIACYERGERSISLTRFCRLAVVYGVPPDQLIARALRLLGTAEQREVVLDLDRMGIVDERPLVTGSAQATQGPGARSAQGDRSSG